MKCNHCIYRWKHLQIDQLILALPSREYYLKSSSKSELMAYHNYMTKIAVILGADPATAAEDMHEVLDFETQLANVSIGPSISPRKVFILTI